MKGIGDFLEIRKEERKNVYASFYAFFCSWMLTTIMGCILPSLRAEYGISYAFAGILSSSQQLGTLTGILIAGYLPFLIGMKKSIVSMSSGMFIGLTMLAVTGNPVFLMLGFLFIGFGRGGVSLANTIATSNSGKPAASLNLLHAIGSFGAAMSPVVAVLVGGVSWRVPIWVLTACCVLAVIILMKSDLTNEKMERKAGQKMVPTSFDFWLVALLLFAFFAVENVFQQFLVTYLIETGLFTHKEALMVQTMQCLMILFGRMICVWASTKIRKSTLLLILSSGTLLSFLVFFSAESKGLIWLGVLAMGLLKSGIFPTGLAQIPSEYKGNSSAVGVAQSFANVSTVLMPGIVGSVADRAGNIRAGFSIILGLLIAVVITVVIMCMRGRNRRDA